jgi:hypothetical protein
LRVEVFNGMIHLDTITHKYAYFVDSNKNLSYDFDVYNKKTGALNNYGLRTVIEDISSLINEINIYQGAEITEEHKNDFFLE